MVMFKNRYMVFEVLLDSSSGSKDPVTLTEGNLSKSIKDSILLNFGECGLAISLGSFQVKYVNSVTKLCIIRVTRQDHQKVWAAITMLKSIGNCLVTFNLLDLSGSIKACKHSALKCEEAKFEQYKLEVGFDLPSEKISWMEKCFQKIKFLES